MPIPLKLGLEYMNSLTTISFFVMKEANKVKSYSLNLQSELISPPLATKIREQGIALNFHHLNHCGF